MRQKSMWKWTLVALIPVSFIVFPIYYVLVGSMMTTSQIFHQPPYLIPPNPQEIIGNYSRSFRILGPYFLNSIIVTLGVMVVILLLSPAAAFALAKMRLKLENIFNFIFMLIQMLPITATIIPLYLFFREFRLINTFVGVILGISSFAVSFIVIMLTSYMRSFPVAMIESAEIDGASLLGIYWKIVLPLSMPALATASLFAFLQGWSNFVFPLTLLQDDKLYPLSIRLFTFVSEFGVQWNYLMAGSFIYSVPSIIVILIGSKFLISGLTAGAFKE